MKSSLKQTYIKPIHFLVSKEHKEGESLPEEKFSTTVETSATTAPTLPEDERIEEPAEEENKVQLDEIQEVVEEKYIKEETKEDKQQEEVKSRPEQPSTLPKTSTPRKCFMFCFID